MAAIRLSLVSLLLLRQLVDITASLGAAQECYGAGGFTAEVWTHCHKISEDMLIYSKMTADSEYLMLGMHIAGHTGWSSLALAGNGGMKGANYVVVRKNDDGEFVAEDRFSLDYVTPQLAARQNVRLMFANEENGGTSWGVLMQKQPCDDDVYPIEDISRFILWAKSPTQSHAFGYHGAITRGQFKFNMVSGPTTPPDFTGLNTVDVLMTNMNVTHLNDASATNSYKCQVFDLEQIIGNNLDVSVKHHAIKIAPKVDPISAKYVHHMVFSQCYEGLYPHTTHGYQDQDCEDMPVGCGDIKWAWAVGAGDDILPIDVGLPVGEGKKWLIIQMHYYNPQADTGVFDNSGLTLTLAPEPRDIDAGMLILGGGTTPNQRDPIPSGIADFHLSPFIVPSECTNRWTSDLNVLGVGQHQHLVGTGMNIDVSRDGVSVGPLRRNRFFDFNHQSLEASGLGQLKPGDQLNLSCTFDTSERDFDTVFGELSEDEMCISFVFYYPLQAQANVNIFTRINESDDGGEYDSWTRCGGAQEEPLKFSATEPTYPQCVASGAIDSAEADAHIKDAGYGPAPAPTPAPTPAPAGGGNLLLLLGGGCALVAAIAGGYFYSTRAGSGFQEQKDEDEVEVGAAS